MSFARHIPQHPLVPRHNHGTAHGQLTQGVLRHDVGVRVVDHELWRKELDVLLDGVDQAEVLLVGGAACEGQASGNVVLALGVLRKYLAAITVHDVDIFAEQEVPLEAVALVDVQVDDHDAAEANPGLQVAHHQEDVRIDAEPAASIETGVVEATREIDSSSQLQRGAGGQDGTLGGQQHGVEHPLAVDPP
jgi:hypothetical protein